MYHMPFHNHSNHTCTCARSLHIVGGVAYAAEHQEWERMSKPVAKSARQQSLNEEDGWDCSSASNRSIHYEITEDKGNFQEMG